MKQEAIERISTRLDRRPRLRRNWMRELFPGQSADEVADALIRMAGEMEIAETRAW